MNEANAVPTRPTYRFVEDFAEPLPAFPEISRRRYVDDEFFKLEIEHVFRKSWLLVALQSEVPSAGSFCVPTIEIAPLVIVRGKDMKIRAFLNSCRHRGSQLATEPTGCNAVITCPLHGWTYSLDGKLIGVKNPDKFTHLDTASHGLVELRCELWGGLVFINFDNDAAPLLDWLTSSLVERFSCMVESPSLRLVYRREWDTFDCNWKIPSENFRETYHTDTVHSASSHQMLDYLNAQFELYPNGHGLQNIPYWEKQHLNLTDWEGMPQLSPLPPLPGVDAPDFASTLKLPMLFPNVIMGFFTVGIHILSFWPVSATKTRIVNYWIGPSWGDGPRPKQWDEMITGFEQVLMEDFANYHSMQRSFEADPDKGCPSANLEVSVYQLSSHIDNVIGRENIPDRLRVPDVLGNFYV